MFNFARRRLLSCLPITRNQTQVELLNTGRILEKYASTKQKASIKDLKPVYVEAGHSERELENLALASLLIPSKYRAAKDIQAFEIPGRPLDCNRYVTLGYKQPNPKQQQVMQWHQARKHMPQWVQLQELDDFTYRPGFAKVIVYRDPKEHARQHFILQWGDGTWLSKHGETSAGATPVYRYVSPTHPALTFYGDIWQVWIKEVQDEIPAPYRRFESVHPRAYVPGANPKHCLSFDTILDGLPCKNEWEETCDDLIFQRNKLLMANPWAYILNRGHKL